MNLFLSGMSKNGTRARLRPGVGAVLLEGLDDPLTPAAFVLSQACQAAVSIVLSIPDWGSPDLDSIAALFGQLPAPQTYCDALHSSLLLYRFLERAAIEIHARLHAGAVPASCLFDPSQYVRVGTVDQLHPDQWNATTLFAEWSAAFTTGLAVSHGESLAERAIRRLRARRGAGVTAPDLAREVGCSVPVLRRAFTRATGMSLRQYAIQLRVDLATDLLCRTDWKLDAVAREVGWKSKKDLHVAFVRRGTTPGRVRRLSDGGGRMVVTSPLRAQMDSAPPASKTRRRCLAAGVVRPRVRTT
jgi:AraC-like DNA-binding protein